MPIAVSCAHTDKQLMPEYGGSMVYVVTGMPDEMASQCPYGHADIAGGWRMTVPLHAIIDRKPLYAVKPCAQCVTMGTIDKNGLSTCICAQCECCQTALNRITDEHVAHVATLKGLK